MIGIFKFMQKVPAGTLNVPMVVTALVHTFWPQALEIGGATTAMFSTGTTTLIGVMLFITGSQFAIADVVPTLKRGFILLLAKLMIGAMGAIIVLRFLGPAGFWGISAIALVTALTATNPGIYLAICNKHGDEIDQTAFGLLNLISVPAIAVTFMGFGTGGHFDVMVLVQVLVPFLAGMLVGNLDNEVMKFLKPGEALILPFLGFCFGSVIDLKVVFTAGLSGLLLTAIFIIVNVPILLLVDRVLLRRPGYAALGVATAAGISITAPGIYAASHPDYVQYVQVAQAQIAMIVVVTSFLMPWLADKLGRTRGASSARISGEMEH